MTVRYEDTGSGDTNVEDTSVEPRDDDNRLSIPSVQDSADEDGKQ